MLRSTGPQKRKAASDPDGLDRDPRSSEILPAALAVFAAEGYAQTDVQEIADRVGIGKGTIYRHFGNKEAIFLATAQDARQMLLKEVDAAAECVAEPLGRLRAGIQAFIAFFDAHPEVVELLIQERAHFRSQPSQTFFQRRDDADNPWPQIFKDLIRDGVIRDLPIEQIREALSRFLFGTMFVNYFTGRKTPLAQQCDEMLDVLLRGLLTDQAKQQH